MTEVVSERLAPDALLKGKAGIPLGRGGSPEETAEAGICLMRSSFITGEVLNINGGAFMRPGKEREWILGRCCRNAL